MVTECKSAKGFSFGKNCRQYLTRTGRIYNLDIYNSFFKNTEEISNIELMDAQWVSFCHQWGLISISRRKTCYSVKISISISRRSYITSFQCTLTKLRYFVDYKCGIVKNMHFRKQTMSSECRQKEHFDILFELNWNSTRCRSRRCNNDIILWTLLRVYEWISSVPPAQHSPQT